MPYDGKVKEETMQVERARSHHITPYVNGVPVMGDGNEWPAGLVLAKGTDGNFIPYDKLEADVAFETGDGSAVTFSGNLGKGLVPGSVEITDGTEAFTDDGFGNLAGDAGGSGYVNYLSGDATVTFNAAVTNEQAITADVKHKPIAVLDGTTGTTADTATVSLAIMFGGCRKDMLVVGTPSPVAASADVTEQLGEEKIFAI